MADPDLSSHMLILLGDGGDPETFGFPCGANARSVKYTNNTGEEVLLDCDNPMGAPAVISRWIESTDTQLSISGRIAKSAFTMWRSWIDAQGSDAKKNIRTELLDSADTGAGHHEMPAILKEFEIGAEGKSTMTFSATIVAAGARVWVPAS